MSHAPRRCPCHSGASYDACCAPYHRREREAPDAVALMRSRYSAFAMGHAEYLWDTLHDDHDDRRRPRDAMLVELRAARTRLRYESLAILDARAQGASAEVLFAAGIRERSADVSFVELSDFARDSVGWRYVSGLTFPRSALPRALDGVRIDEFLALAATLR